MAAAASARTSEGGAGVKTAARPRTRQQKRKVVARKRKKGKQRTVDYLLDCDQNISGVSHRLCLVMSVDKFLFMRGPRLRARKIAPGILGTLVYGSGSRKGPARWI